MAVRLELAFPRKERPKWLSTLRLIKLWFARAQRHRDTLGRPAELAAEMDIVKSLEVRVSPQLNAWSARKRTMVRPRGFTASSLFFTFSRNT
jgi:hypothetical protein